MNRGTKHILLLAIIAITLPALAANFAITRMALTFSDQKAVTIVERDAPLAAQAEITFSGNGLLRAAWEVAGPSPHGNDPQYRVLGNVQQPLAGRDATTLPGPRLPTDSIGVYLVRIKVTEPALVIETPVIRYSVIEKKKSH